MDRNDNLGVANIKMNEKTAKEVKIIVDKFFLETQRLVNRLVEKIYEIEGISLQ